MGFRSNIHDYISTQILILYFLHSIHSSVKQVKSKGLEIIVNLLSSFLIGISSHYHHCHFINLLTSMCGYEFKSIQVLTHLFILFIVLNS